MHIKTTTRKNGAVWRGKMVLFGEEKNFLYPLRLVLEVL